MRRELPDKPDDRWPNERWRTIVASLLVFAGALAIGRFTNIWLMVGAGSLTVLWLVLRSRQRIATASSGPSAVSAVLGLACGALMLAATHLVYPLAAELVPALAVEAGRLYGWLEDWPGAVWGAPVLAAAVLVEELVFRGVLVEETAERWSSLALLVGGSALYALPQVAAGTWLLPVVAFGCGLVWMAQRLLSGGLTVPFFTHLVWSLGVFSAFPLEG